MTFAIGIEDVREAAARIAGRAHRTPLMTCGTLDRVARRRLFFKCEQLQKVGAFKFRGACNAVLSLSEAEAGRGVVTHSSGNHAQALALAASMRGIAAHVVMPSTSIAVKRRAVEGYGARIIECEPTLEAREATAAAVVEETGGTFIHPYDRAEIMAGQGTAALELMEAVPDLDAVVAPVGGGGLLSGTAVASRGMRPGIRVFAGEPEGADDAFRSKEAGEFIPQTAPRTIADGLLTSMGELTWPIIRDRVEAVVTVDDEAVVAAMRLLWERAKCLVEPSSAVALAAVLDDAFPGPDELPAVGIILSGGNVDLDRLPWRMNASM